MTMSEWLAEKLTGEIRTLPQTYEWIRQESTIPFKRREPVPHQFSIGAFRGGCPSFVQVTNITGVESSGKPQVGRDFLVNEQRIDRPLVWFVGSGAKAVSEDDRRLLSIKTGVQPERPEELIELLADLNRRTSEHFLHGGTVSAACHSLWVSPTGGIKGQFFTWEKQFRPETFLTPVILFGINVRENDRDLLLPRFRRRNLGGLPPAGGPLTGV
jgi:hypothetical protein